MDYTIQKWIDKLMLFKLHIPYGAIAVFRKHEGQVAISVQQQFLSLHKYAKS